jgi:hypothetical protein
MRDIQTIPPNIPLVGTPWMLDLRGTLLVIIDSIIMKLQIKIKLICLTL